MLRWRCFTTAVSRWRPIHLWSQQRGRLLLSTPPKDKEGVKRKPTAEDMKIAGEFNERAYQKAKAMNKLIGADAILAMFETKAPSALEVGSCGLSLFFVEIRN